MTVSSVHNWSENFSHLVLSKSEAKDGGNRISNCRPVSDPFEEALTVCKSSFRSIITVFPNRLYSN